MRINILSYATLLTLILPLIAACKRGNESYTRSEDTTPDAITLHLTDNNNFKIASFFTTEDTINPVATYILVPKSSDIPDNLPKGTIIRTPVSNLLIYSTVTAEALKELHSIESVKGVVDAKYFAQPEIINGIKNGSVTDCGAAENPTGEKVIAMKPDAILLNIYEGMNVAGVDALGVPVIKMTDNYETSPLGRAEWIKFLGALTHQESTADSIYNAVKINYQKQMEIASGINKKPLVLTDNMYQGVWYVPGGHSFQARMIADAGGIYFRKDDSSTGSLSLSFEEVLDKGRNADVWIIKSFGQDLNRNSLIGMDNRYASFSAVNNDGVYCANTQNGAYFNDLVYHPDRLLEDYVAIFKAVSEGKKAVNLRYFKLLEK